MVNENKKCTLCKTTAEHNANFYKRELDEAKRILGIIEDGLSHCKRINPHLCERDALAVSITPDLRQAIQQVIR